MCIILRDSIINGLIVINNLVIEYYSDTFLKIKIIAGSGVCKNFATNFTGNTIL